MAGNDYHSYIYETEQRRIRGDFEGAYANCEDVWPTQHQLDLPHFVYIKGLVRDRFRTLGRTVRVLDVGCGYGDLVQELNSFRECDAVGLEISPSALRKSRQRFGPDLRLVVGDVNQGIPTSDGVFDIVLLLGVFWFVLGRIDFCLAELDRVAANQAEFVYTLHVPDNPIGKENIASYDDFLNILRRRFTVIDGFKFYQRRDLRTLKPLAETMDDILIRCRRKSEG